jgi:hypothetical protein
LKEERFRGSSRKRATSETFASPAVGKSRRRSTQSSSDVADPRILPSASVSHILENTLQAVTEAAEEADAKEVSVEADADAGVISENEPMVAAEVVKLQSGSMQTPEIDQEQDTDHPKSKPEVSIQEVTAVDDVRKDQAETEIQPGVNVLKHFLSSFLTLCASKFEHLGLLSLFQPS